MIRMLSILAVILFGLLSFADAQIIPSNTTFAWDPPEAREDVTYYYLLCHSTVSGEYDTYDCVNVGGVSQYTWRKALGAGRHYFTVRTMGILNGQELISGHSNEVSVSLLPPTGGAAKVQNAQ